ncbi:RluA family pseudouridine synthase [Tenacibaculum aiptasiae]|uniref:RluA family pseudouridine synthase n=1 Tax=Tenacibaculum aiptasiae TaxID=426481 RepID=A0A7J5ALZ5_9FLAO|nr:RluA family pseudouridine synthase [Tenacibaculum aiptasiae]KAB1158617.1 RluA family pseudouridine synthase [Tenacibaculum aiptasiae]
MTKFIHFTSSINAISLPQKFDYPHNYSPHKLAITAANELQEYLKKQTDFEHNFGIENNTTKDALGKMFGVLVVKNSNEEIGYLAAFSGKIENTSVHQHFVPPVYDILDKNGFYIQTEKKLNQINQELFELENNIQFTTIKNDYNTLSLTNEKLLNEEHSKIKARRKLRKQLGKQNNQLNINEEFYLREYEVYLKAKILPLEKEFLSYQQKVNQLKKQRKKLSAWVQTEIFKHYQFLNQEKETQNLLDIFKNSKQNIPAGAGDCCAPKLLQYAFKHGLTPICMAEFWWGKPLATSVRKHKNFYPACTGKCKPILTHMLKGMLVTENPLLEQLSVNKKEITVIYEDDALMVINKPEELLTVAGKEIQDSVYQRIKNKYPEITGPIIVHRLDMSTSGILLIAKNEKIYKALQAQFINKTVHKRYVALLDGTLSKNNGSINLPLRVDLDDRPKQLVCNEHGKPALTKWETIEVYNGKTKVHFYPITGRTHQLRVHAAHNLGLNTSIVGDDLYGEKSNRLHLHAEHIEFIHPITKEKVSFTSACPF